MARCGCGGQCSCVVRGGTGIAVSGIGTPSDPYVVSPVGIGKTLARVEGVGTNLVFVYTDGSVSEPVSLPTTNLSTVGDASITTAKLVTGAVTSDKLANQSVSSAKLADGAVTRAKLGAEGVLFDRGQWLAGIDYQVGDVVTQGGQRWLARIPHRATAPFNVSAWIALSLPPAPRTVKRSEWSYPAGSGSLFNGEIENALGYTEAPGNTAPVTWASGVGFKLQAAGLWSISMQGYSDGGSSHIAYMGLRWAGGPFTDRSDRKFTTVGFAGAGALTHYVSFTGIVAANQLDVPIRDVIGNQSPGGALTFGNRMTFEYLGV